MPFTHLFDKTQMAKKYVYFFGAGKADGNSSMKNLLGGKGANLAEMAGHKKLKLPVPPGFTITTEVCTEYYKNKQKYPKELKKQVGTAMAKIEKIMGKKFGDPNDPLLMSIRSGARSSMPGMMETILNAGLTTKTIPGLIKKTKNPRFVYDAYRRLMMMYSDVVMEKGGGIEPKTDHDAIRHKLETALENVKKKNKYKSDTDLTVDDLMKLCDEFKAIIKKTLKKPFPDTHEEQLWGSIGAVFSSWMGKRAIAYRKIESLPDWWGTAVNVQTMVFGNTGNKSATGVAFTRNPATGENMSIGEWLPKLFGREAGDLSYIFNMMIKNDNTLKLIKDYYKNTKAFVLNSIDESLMFLPYGLDLSNGQIAFLQAGRSSANRKYYDSCDKTQNNHNMANDSEDNNRLDGSGADDGDVANNAYDSAQLDKFEKMSFHPLAKEAFKKCCTISSERLLKESIRLAKRDKANEVQECHVFEAQKNLERGEKRVSVLADFLKTSGGIVTGGSISGFYYALEKNDKSLVMMFFMTSVIGLLMVFAAHLMR